MLAAYTGLQGSNNPKRRPGPSNHPQALCGPPLGLSRLDLAFGHKLHTMTENLHALSTHGPQFLGRLDLTGSSVVEVLELRRHRWIRRRWRLSEPLRLPCQHRPLHVQTRLAQPPAQPPLVPPTQDSKCSAHQVDPILFLSTVIRVVQAHSAWCSAFSRGSPPTEIRRRPVLKFTRPQDEYSILRMQRYASLNQCDGLSHRCDTVTRVWQYERSTSVEDHDVAFVNHSWCCQQKLADLSSLECHSA